MPFSNPFRSLTLPNGAGPDDPRIVFGPDVPPELNPLPNGWIITGAAIWYADAVTYHWYAVGYDPNGGNAGVVARGNYYGFGGIGVRILDTYNIPGLQWKIGFPDTVTGLPTGKMQFEGAEFLLGVLLNDPKATPWLVDGVSHGRGLQPNSYVDTTVSVTGIAAETVIFTSPGNVRFYPGRAYEIRVRGVIDSNVASDVGIYRAKINNVATQRGIGYHLTPPAAGSFVSAEDDFLVANKTGAMIQGPILMTLAPTAGTVALRAGTNMVCSMGVWDVGAETDYPNARQI